MEQLVYPVVTALEFLVMMTGVVLMLAHNEEPFDTSDHDFR